MPTWFYLDALSWVLALNIHMASADIEEGYCVCIMTVESNESVTKGSVK